jgi:hypothetical protein
MTPVGTGRQQQQCSSSSTALAPAWTQMILSWTLCWRSGSSGGSSSSSSSARLLARQRGSCRQQQLLLRVVLAARLARGRACAAGECTSSLCVCVLFWPLA